MRKMKSKISFCIISVESKIYLTSKNFVSLSGITRLKCNCDSMSNHKK